MGGDLMYEADDLLEMLYEDRSYLPDSGVVDGLNCFGADVHGDPCTEWCEVNWEDCEGEECGECDACCHDHRRWE